MKKQILLLLTLVATMVWTVKAQSPTGSVLLIGDTTKEGQTGHQKGLTTATPNNWCWARN